MTPRTLRIGLRCSNAVWIVGQPIASVTQHVIRCENALEPADLYTVEQDSWLEPTYSSYWQPPQTCLGLSPTLIRKESILMAECRCLPRESAGAEQPLEARWYPE
jgi:hypothetical protein